MKSGDAIRIVVRELDEQGSGVAEVPEAPAPVTVGGRTRDSGAAVSSIALHVPGALPGEDVSARVDQVSAHRPVAWGSLRAVHVPSPDRVPPACPAYGRCGGCVLQHFDARAQLAWKQASLRRLIATHPALANVPVKDAVASPLTLGYRNNSKLIAARAPQGHLVLGAYEPRSHDVVELAGCAVVEPPLDAVATVLAELLTAHAVQPYDEVRLVGTLRYVILRANAKGQVLVTLVTAADAFDEGPAAAGALLARAPNVVGIVQNVNLTRGNTIFGTTERTILGDSAIVDQIGDVRLRVSSRAFFQANRQVARAAYAAIAAAVAPTGNETVVDAYAGVGGIALTLAATAGSVVGIEEYPAAVEDAARSAALNGIANARFIAGDVAAQLGHVASADIVVLNPPRKGCEPAVLQRAAALRPRKIAYLSCSPPTLLRDLTILAALGYRTADVTPFDMLPHTAHVEALAILVGPSG